MAYNKLVRDKIPAIISAKGQIPVTKTLTQDEYIEELIIKLLEEVKEVKKDRIVDELADVKEVLESLITALGFSEQEVEAVRVKKRDTNGGFEDKIYLVDVKK